MAVTATWAFPDAGAYEEKIRAARVTGLVIGGRGSFSASLQQVNLGKIWMQRGAESLPRTLHINLDSSRSPILFLASDNARPILDSGFELEADRILFYSVGAAAFQRTEDACQWASMSITPEELDAAGRTLLDRAISSPRLTTTVRPDPAAMQALRHLHRSVNAQAREQPDLVAHPEVERAIEAELILAMMRCLDFEPARLPRRQSRRLAIMRQFYEWLEFNNDRPVYLQELCDALNVTARTLRECCQEHLGMGPIRYLWLRRMELARRALLQAPPKSATVTQIAVDLGFWELGRFAVSYRSLFGEHPSDTIARAPLR